MTTVGQRLGERYRVVRSIARGGMGHVFEALDERTGRTVAVKVLVDELAQDPTCRERFRREARFAASLSHPGLVLVHEVSLETSPSFLVMELLEGDSLARVLAREGRLPWRRVARLARDLLEGLAVVHEASIVHRDLKPANVMVVPTARGERAKLIDLGVAQLMTGAAYQRLTASGAIVGTPAFMSPEQLAGEPVGPASDLWSVGVLLHTCLTGERPFREDDLAALLRAIASEEPPRIESIAPDVPREVAELVRSLLRKRADARPTSASHVARSLSELLDASVSLPGARVLAGEESFAGFSHERPVRREDGDDGAPSRLVTREAPAIEPGPSTPAPTPSPAFSVAAPSVGAAPASSRRALQLAGAGVVGAALASALGVTCVAGVVLAWVIGDPRAWLATTTPANGPGAPATTSAPFTSPPPVTPQTIRAHRLAVIVDGPGDASAANTALQASLPPCLPLDQRRPGPVIHYVAWLDGAGGVERIERRTDAVTPTEQRCVEDAIRATHWSPPGGERPIANVSVNALW